jgi:cardiolipin synthase
MASASAFVPLWDRQTEWRRRLAMIHEARVFLYLSTFYIEYDAYSTELLDALTRACRRGVAVHLLIDGFGQRLGGVLMSPDDRARLRAQFDALMAAGGTVAFYRPHRLAQRQLGGGQHVKIQISEQGEAIFGSSNITRTSFERWNEYSVAVRGPVSRLLLESYREIGGTVASTHLEQLATLPSDADHQMDYWLCNPNHSQGVLGPLGWRGTNLVTDRLIDMLDRATSSIRLTSFYFKPTPSLMAAVLRAARRGVAVEVFHSHRDALPATDLAWIAAAAHYEALLEAGVTVYENRRGEHSKIVLVDEARAAFGSYNFEDAAHDRLAEAMLVSNDPRAVGPALQIFDELRRNPDNARVHATWRADLSPRLRTRLAGFARFKRWM